jgi:uncharacterized protein YdhG (YjbR/CyaY superfamily)
MGERSSEIDAYLEALPAERREALSAVRLLVAESLPEAQETMEYRMPTIKYRGHVLAAFASRKRHMSLYTDVDVIEAHRRELQGLSVTKAAIRFKRLEQLPLDLVRRILMETKARIDYMEADCSGR